MMVCLGSGGVCLLYSRNHRVAVSFSEIRVTGADADFKMPMNSSFEKIPGDLVMMMVASQV